MSQVDIKGEHSCILTFQELHGRNTMVLDANWCRMYAKVQVHVHVGQVHANVHANVHVPVQ